MIGKISKCPYCNYPHKYTEIHFKGGINDYGYWILNCFDCTKKFIVQLKNPQESYTSHSIEEKGYDNYEGNLKISDQNIRYNTNYDKINHKFDTTKKSLYICNINNENLEPIAYNEIKKELPSILIELKNAVNYALSSRHPIYEYVVIHVDVPCKCRSKHTATFYIKFSTNNIIYKHHNFLLADITKTNLNNQLTGLMSKNDVLILLEKMIIRWHLIADRIIIVTPFVGHQYLKKEEKISIWKWLLSILDVKRSLFITRDKNFKEYKNLMKEIYNLDYNILQEYQLDNQLISMQLKKQDFHAKFFAGLIFGKYEIISGSANLVMGSSIENIAFNIFDEEIFKEKYLDILNIRNIPPKNVFAEYFILIDKQNNEWTARESNKERLAKNEF